MAEIRVMKRVLANNDALAADQLAGIDRQGVLSLNLMSGPGAGKTSLIERTIECLRDRVRIYVIEGDIQGSLDAERVAAAGAGVTQVNTQGACHLDAMMLQSVLPGIDLAATDLLIIENVGNLVCPAEFRLPAHFNVTLVSTPEGSDKPAKYPLMFERSDLVLITKTDLLPYVDFDPAEIDRAVARLRVETPVLRLSCRTGVGLDGWLDWLEQKLAARGRVGTGK
ncbi:MAG: hydrogenase nickel incorporation protein HypB [bacterium]